MDDKCIWIEIIYGKATLFIKTPDGHIQIPLGNMSILDPRFESMTRSIRQANQDYAYLMPKEKPDGA